MTQTHRSLKSKWIIVVCIALTLALISFKARDNFIVDAKAPMQLLEADPQHSKARDDFTGGPKAPVQLLEAEPQHKQHKSWYYYDCHERHNLQPENASNEWSFDRWQREYCQNLEKETFPSPSPSEKNILFVDGREECERYREFLITVRKSSFLGHIVLLVYLTEDRDRCGRLANDLSVEIFYTPSPRWEWTLFQYHGVVNYFTVNPQAVKQYQMASAVRPDHVAWCNNPFREVKTLSEGNRKLLAFSFRDPRRDYYTAPHHNSRHRRTILNDNFLIGTPFGLFEFMRLLLDAVSRTRRIAADPSWSYLRSDRAMLSYADQHVKVYKHFDKDACLLWNVGGFCHTHRGVALGNYYCYASDDKGEPIYTPYCYFEHRLPVWEVPANLSLETVAFPSVSAAAKTIREARGKGGPNDVFGKAKLTVPQTPSVECPNGKLVIITMMGGYHMDKVKDYVGSFLFYANPTCTKLVLMLSNRTGIHKVVEMYPTRIEVAVYSDDEFAPTAYKNRGVMDQRYEVALNWLEQHHHEYRFAMATDSRDFVWLSDPLSQLVDILSQGGFLNDEFIGSVVENFALGSYSWANHDVNHYAKLWLKPCGDFCFATLAESTYHDSKEPTALINSGNVIGTTLGMLHYYRFHIRMTVVSAYDFSGADQGLMNFYLHGLAQQAKYPHKILLFSSARSGFANPTHIHRLARRPSSKDPQLWEYTVKDCNNNILSSAHQADRAPSVDRLLRNNPSMGVAWQDLWKNNSYHSFFNIPIPNTEAKDNWFQSALSSIVGVGLLAAVGAVLVLRRRSGNFVTISNF